MVELVHNKTYDNYNLDLKTGVALDESFEIELKFDEPKTGEAKKGDRTWTWYMFNVKMDDKDVTFFASGMTEVFGKKLPDLLLEYKQGTRLKLTKTLSKKEIMGAYRPLWKVENLSGTTVAPAAQTVNSVLVDLFVSRSGGVKQNEEWLNAQLTASEVIDEVIRTEIKTEYNARTW